MRLPAIHYFVGVSIIISFTAAYILLVLNKYWQFEYFYRDNVYFDTALWKAAHFLEPVARHYLLGNINVLGDHFWATIFALSPLYLLVPKQEVVLVGMSLIYGGSALVGMFIGFKLLRSRLATFALLVAYFLYLGTQNGFIYGFHEVYLTALFVMTTFFCIVTGKWRWYWVSLALLLLTKESMAAVAVSLGLFTFIEFPTKRREALMTIVGSMVYFFVATHFVIPYFSHRFLYQEVNLPRNFTDLALVLVSPPDKVKTFVVSMATFSFLPLLNASTLSLVLQDFLVRYVFAISGNVQYTLNFHYNVALAPLLFVSSVWSVYKIERRRRFRWLVPVLSAAVLLFSLVFHRFSNPRGPLLLVLNGDFYQTTERNKFLWRLVEATPKSGKVMTQNHLGYALSHRDVYEMATHPQEFNKISPDYVVFDLRPGQNPNNFVPLTELRTREMKTLLLESGKYQIYFQEGEMFILQKVANDCDDLKNPYCFFKVWPAKGS